MTEGDEIELFDPETANVKVEGLTVAQIRQLKLFYQSQTKDFDLEKLFHLTRRMG